MEHKYVIKDMELNQYVWESNDAKLVGTDDIREADFYDSEEEALANIYSSGLFQIIKVYAR
ncbi:MAG: hypothetical protein PHN69_03065 [Candidatus Pacebacteria bacterium]|nr:hypothetical protein [Candidatus Paceibacterota bacterium]